MRWFVEVTSLGKPDTESVQVDAESWQKALEIARSERGDGVSMAGFSIELVEDGCRAVDPELRLKYSVRPVLTESQSTRPPPVAAPAPVVVSAPPRPAVPAPAPVPSAPVAPVVTAPAPVVPVPVTSAPAPVTAAASEPSNGAAVPVPHVEPPRPREPAPPSIIEPSVPRADVVANVPSQIVFKREQERTAAVPVTYREYVYLVPPGTTEAAAETLLRAQIELVRTSLARTAQGKLVNLAVFDATFQGKATSPPVATLSWKDWRGEPVIAFPRRAPPPAPPAVAAPVVAAPVVAAPVVAAPVVAAPVVTAPVVAAAPEPPVPAVAPAPAPAPAATAPVVEITPAVDGPAPPSLIVAPEPPPVEPPLASPPAEPAPLDLGREIMAHVAPASGPRPSGAPGARVAGEDLIADLFEAMHDLHFLRDALEGGEFVLALGMGKIPSNAGIVYLYDIDRREFVVTNTRGAVASQLLLQRYAESDPMLNGAMRKRRAVVIEDASQSEARSLDRYVTLGGARSVIVAPVMQAGRFLGAIEILNPLDDLPYTESDGNAMMYIADQFAEFVAARGVVTDPERIAARRS